MAEFDIKTISCSSKIKAKIEVNIGSLESKYNGNQLDFRKCFIIDSGKGTKYNAKLRFLDFEYSQRRGICFLIEDVQKLEIELNGAFSGTNFKVSSDKYINKLDFLDLDGKKGKIWLWFCMAIG